MSYPWHHKNRPYHIDYVFLPQHWTTQIQRVEVGSHAAWSKLSDHVPPLGRHNPVGFLASQREAGLFVPFGDH